MWLARVEFPSHPEVCAIKQAERCHKHQTRFDKGDFMIAVQFFGRSIDGDEERRTFVMGEENIDILYLE